MTFHEERQLNFMTLQAGKMKFFDFMTFQVFCDLYESCWQIFFKYKLSKQISRFAFKIKLP